MPLDHIGRDVGESDTTDAGRRAGKTALDHFVADAERLKNLGTVVRRDRGDTHFRHDLEDPRVGCLPVVGENFIGCLGFEILRSDHRPQGLEREVRADCRSPEPDQASEMVNVPSVAGLGDDARPHPETLADQVIVYG